jgi:intein-encoded DNA endonuclease-like protein
MFQNLYMTLIIVRITPNDNNQLLLLPYLCNRKDKAPIMAKSNYQESAMEYAKEYLERLLDLEDYVGQKVEEKLRSMVQQEVKDYMNR